MLQIFARKDKGFTLIELLVVVAIIALLTSIALIYLGPTRAKARDTRRQSDIKQINLAMEMCYSKEDCGPGTNKYPVHTGTPPVVNSWTQIDNDGAPVYLTIPSDPTNSDPYQYKWFATAEQYYCIAARLESFSVTTFYCASNEGTTQKEYTTGNPTKDDCCGMDVDD